MNEAKLVLFCGISGSGKSTKAAKTVGDTSILLSSDSLRAIIGKGEEDQSVSPIVFAVMRNMTEYFLKQGKTVVIDATNPSVKSRKPFIEIARKLGVPISAWVVQVPLALAKQRNLQRNRIVPEEVIDRQFNNFVVPTLAEVDEVILC